MPFATDGSGNVIELSGGQWKPVDPSRLARDGAGGTAVFDGKSWLRLPTPESPEVGPPVRNFRTVEPGNTLNDLIGVTGTGVANAVTRTGALPRLLADTAWKSAVEGELLRTDPSTPPKTREAIEAVNTLMTGQPDPEVARTQSGVVKALPTLETMENMVYGTFDIPKYEPTTPVGRVYQEGITGGASAAAAGPVGFALGALGGAGQQAAAELGLPTWAQFAAGLGLPAGAAGAGAILNRIRPTPQRVMASAIGKLTDAEFNEAAKMMERAVADGDSLTWAEAIAKVTNGGSSGLLSAQRVAEQSFEGGATMNRFMAQRAPSNEAAINRVLDRLGPQRTGQELADIPANLQAAAAKVEQGAKRYRNQRTSLSYGVINANNALSPAGFKPLESDLLVQSHIKAVLKDPAYAAELDGLPPGALPVLDAAKKHLDDDIRSAIRNGRDNEARLLTAAQHRITEAIDAEYPGYSTARELHQDLTRELVDPLKRGPIGALSKTPTMAGQETILAPRVPKTLDETTIRDTVGRLAFESPEAVRDWLRQSIKSQFDEIAQANTGGPNQWGGAKFAAAIAGNSQQAKNLQALVETALPNGKEVWSGFNRLLNVYKAQGFRHRPGSPTNQNARISADLTGSLSPVMSKPLNRIQSWLDGVRFGRNTEKLSELLLDPQAGRIIANLALVDPASKEGEALILNLLGRVSAAEEPTPAMLGGNTRVP